MTNYVQPHRPGRSASESSLLVHVAVNTGPVPSASRNTLMKTLDIVTLISCLVLITLFACLYTLSIRRGLRLVEREQVTIKKTLRILCYGDSLTAGFHVKDGQVSEPFTPYCRYMQKKLQADWRREERRQRRRRGRGRAATTSTTFAVDIVGYCGWPTEWMLRHMDAPRNDSARSCRAGPGIRTALKRKHYDLVILLAGANDLRLNYETEPIIRNLESLISLCRKHHVPRVLTLDLPDYGSLLKSPKKEKQWRQVKASLERLAKKERHSGFLTFIGNPVNYDRHPDMFEPKGGHYTEAGYKKLGEDIVPVVKRLLTS